MYIFWPLPTDRQTDQGTILFHLEGFILYNPGRAVFCKLEALLEASQGKYWCTYACDICSAAWHQLFKKIHVYDLFILDFSFIVLYRALLSDSFEHLLRIHFTIFLFVSKLLSGAYEM